MTDDLFALTQAWTESTATWGTQPTASGSPLASVTKLSPTASVRDVATTSGWLTVAMPPTVATTTGALCAG